MATLFRPLFSTFLSVLFLLLHLGCFIFSSSQNNPSKKRKLSSHPNSVQPPPSRPKNSTIAISSSWSCIKRIFSSNKPNPITSPTHHNPSIPSPCSSTRSLHKSIIIPISPIPESDISSDPLFFPLRNDIYPCTLCGEVFQSPIHLEQHQSIKHAISELTDGESGNNIVRIIFQTGWVDKRRNPSIHRILKIHNGKRILTRFEEYRECVKLKASRNAVVMRDERCIADGNELLRFHCTTFMCELGQNGNSSICTQQYCSVCGIIRSGFSRKMDGISMQPTSWRAHVAVPEEIEEEFGFMNVKRAMLVCRVIAGRVGCDPGYVDKEDPGYDSLVGRENGVQTRLDEEDELLVDSVSSAVKLESVICDSGEQPDYTSVNGQVESAKRLNVVRKLLDGFRRQGEWSAIKTSIGAVRRVVSDRYSKSNRAVDMEEKKEHGSGRKSGPLLSGTAYCLSSCCMIMLNEVVLSSYSFNAGVSLMLYQNLISTLIVIILGCSGTVTVEKLNWKLIKVWIPVNLIVIGMLVSGMYSLKYINIAMVTILKNVTNILTAIGELYIFGKRKNQKVWTAMFVVIISAVSGGITDLSFDAMGYAWQSVNCILTASYSLTLRHVMDRAKQFTKSGSLMKFQWCY